MRSHICKKGSYEQKDVDRDADETTSHLHPKIYSNGFMSLPCKSSNIGVGAETVVLVTVCETLEE